MKAEDLTLGIKSVIAMLVSSASFVAYGAVEVFNLKSEINTIKGEMVVMRCLLQQKNDFDIYKIYPTKSCQ